MNILSKVLFVCLLLFGVLFVSFKQTRVVSLEYNEQVTQTMQSQENDNLNSATSDFENLHESTSNIFSGNSSETQTILGTISVEKSLEKVQTSTTKESSNALSGDVSLSEILNSTSTNSEIAFLESTEIIYSEITEFEKAIRRYISKGYKISTLNTLNLKNAGLINEEIMQKYDVTFRVKDGGYDIIISLKYPISEEDKNKLLKKKGITINGEVFQYIFWIKAYK